MIVIPLNTISSKTHSMNRYNDWETILKYANEDLEKYGYSLLLTEDEEGYYNLEVWKNGKFFDIYAENYWEDELTDLLTEAWHDLLHRLS